MSSPVGPADRSHPRPFRHCAGFYNEQIDLVARAVGWIGDGIRRGDVVLLDLFPAVEAAVCQVLGRVPAAHRLDRPRGPAMTSGQTTAFVRARQFEAALGDGRGITAAVQYDPDLDGDAGFWAELEATTNLAMSHLPVNLACFFPRFSTRPAVLACARGAHPMLLCGHRAAPNPRSACPDGPNVAVTPPARGPADAGMDEIGPRELVALRLLVDGIGRAAGHSEDRVDHAVIAVNEVATYLQVTTGQPIRVRIWHAAGTPLIQVSCPGPLAEPLPGLRPPAGPGDGEQGFRVARQLSDYLHVWVDADGTHVRIQPGSPRSRPLG